MTKPTTGYLKHARRRRVAYLRLRGMSQREIQEVLSLPPDQEGLRNPRTGKPFSLGTINGDCQAIEAQWHEEMMRELSAHREREVAELREARRAAWEQKDMGEVRLNISLEADLLGTKDLPTSDTSVIVRIIGGIDLEEI